VGVKAGVCALLVVAAVSEAAACPVCDTATGAAVRAGIFDQQFEVTLALVLLPLTVLAAVVSAVHAALGGVGGAATPARHGVEVPTGSPHDGN
jgi:hypothetical protein